MSLKRIKEKSGRYWIGNFNIVHMHWKHWRVWQETEEGGRDKIRGMIDLGGFHTLREATEFVYKELPTHEPT